LRPDLAMGSVIHYGKKCVKSTVGAA